jgi:signal transduction histidine kinase
MTYRVNGYEVEADDINEQQSQYLNTLINAVYTSEVNEGVLSEYNLRYYSVDTLMGKRIVFLDKEYEDTTLEQLIITFVLVGAVALAAFLIISIVIARIAVAPVERSLKQQMQLVADASHELKTPITVIAANADVLLASKESTISQQAKWLEYIRTEAARMTELVNNMLYLAKTDENTGSEVLGVISLSDTINSSVLPFESISYEKNKHLTIDIKPNISIMGNEGLIKQLIIILLDNSFKYSDDNGRIAISVYEDQDRAYLSVWNSGEPIPREQQRNIFERFYRVDKSRSRSEGGYGLGLSIANRIAETLNAKITVHSTAETGTCFTCIFKRVKKRG